MERENVAQQVQDKLHRFEAALEAAMKEGGEFLALTTEARAQLGLSSTVGAAETAKIMRALEGLGVAHENTAGAHKGYTRLAGLLGLRPKATGIWKDSIAAAEGEPTTLRRVA